MSETVVMPQRDDVERYVREVRAALADLPAEELDELTGGMEADLGELAAETPEGLRPRLGEPEAYAAELRAAAGLPPRAVAARTSWWRGPVTGGRAAWDRLVSENPLLQRAAPWFRDLAPVWWVARGVLVGWALLGVVLGLTALPLWFVVLPFVVVSIHLGRRERDRAPWVRGSLLAANVIAVLALVPALAIMSEPQGPSDEPFAEAYLAPGLVYDGEQVTNLYLYDAEGHRLSGVRIFDDQGRSVSLDNLPYATDTNPTWLHDVHGSAWTNIYPVPLNGDYRGTDPWSTEVPDEPSCPDCSPNLWTPHLSVPPLAEKVPTSSPTSSASATAGPNATAGPTAPAGPTATARPTATATAAPTPSP